MLVAQVARDRHAGQVADAVAVDLGRGPDPGQHRRRDPHRIEQGRLPGERLEPHQHRARGVGDVDAVDATVDAAGEMPDQPRIDRPEQQLARLGGGPSFRPAVLEDPGQLERRRIGRDRQPGQAAEPVRPAIGGQPLACRGGPGVLPDDGVVDRAPGPARPDDGRLALVADADGGQRAGVRTRLTQRDPDAGPHALEDLVGVVLDPAGSRRDLGVLQLVAGDRLPGPVEQDAAAARRPLIDGGDERPRLHQVTSSCTGSGRSMVIVWPTSRIW